MGNKLHYPISSISTFMYSYDSCFCHSGVTAFATGGGGVFSSFKLREIAWIFRQWQLQTSSPDMWNPVCRARPVPHVNKQGLTNFVVAGGGPAGRWPVAGRCGTHKCNFDRCAQSFE